MPTTPTITGLPGRRTSSTTSLYFDIHRNSMFKLRPSRSYSRRTVLTAVCTLFSTLYLCFTLFGGSSASPFNQFNALVSSIISGTPAEPPWRQALRGRTFAVYDSQNYHDEVQGAVLATLKQFEDVEINHYKQGFRYGFGATVSGFWNGPNSTHDESAQPFGRFWEHLKLDREAAAAAGKSMITDIIFTTCDIDLGKGGYDKLVEQWDLRKPDEKFRLLCLRHWSSGSFTKMTEILLRTNAITHSGLGDHNTAAHAKAITEQIWDAVPYLGIAAETFIPMFPPTTLQDLSVEAGLPLDMPANGMTSGQGWPLAWKPSTSKRIDTAAMQGNLGEDHRAMNKTLSQLFQFIEEDPHTWGYHPPSEENKMKYTPFDRDDPELPNPFTLQLVGHWQPKIPAEFSLVCQKHEQSNYEKFFRILNGADVMLPAFRDDLPYAKDRASSTIGVAATVRTVLITDDEIANAYGYFCPVFEARRPPGMSEMEYIKWTRVEETWDREYRSPTNLAKCQDEWQDRNGRMFVNAFTKPLYAGDEDWLALETAAETSASS